jgi:hypothetical protein
VVTRKTGKRSRRTRPEPAPVHPSRARSHSLAPPHLGEVASAAVLAVAILGLAVFIAGVAMAVSGFTMGGALGSAAPPNADQLGTGQVIGGFGLAVLGLVLSGSALALLADMPSSRPIAIAAAGVAAVLSAIGVFLVQAQPAADTVLAISLAVAAAIFAVAAVILVRTTR